MKLQTIDFQNISTGMKHHITSCWNKRISSKIKIYKTFLYSLYTEEECFQGKHCHLLGLQITNIDDFCSTILHTKILWCHLMLNIHISPLSSCTCRLTFRSTLGSDCFWKTGIIVSRSPWIRISMSSFWTGRDSSNVDLL